MLTSKVISNQRVNDDVVCALSLKGSLYGLGEVSSSSPTSLRQYRDPSLKLEAGYATPSGRYHAT